jgi:hypothetical protein
MDMNFDKERPPNYRFPKVVGECAIDADASATPNDGLHVQVTTYTKRLVVEGFQCAFHAT